MLKKKNNKVTDESLFCSSCLFCKKKQKNSEVKLGIHTCLKNLKKKKKLRMVLKTVY